MHKVFLVISSGEDGHVEDVLLGSLILRFSDDSLLVIRSVGGGHISDGWLTAQLSFLAFQVLLSFGALEDGSHFDVLPQCCTQHEFSKEYLGGTRRNRVAHMVALENLQRGKVLVLDS
jgi:hypothetical protein